MQFEISPLPYPHGYLHEIPITLPYDLIRLQQEKNILSKGLADCVTYLRALCEKQAKNTRQLNAEPSAPKAKRRKLQQAKRHLDNEIRNRRRDERAWLNNLQACETNIFLANMKAYHLTHAFLQASMPVFSPTLCTPTLYSYSGSETTDITWDGWTDEAVVAPVQKKGSDPFFVEDVDLDACTRDFRRNSAVTKDVKRPPPLSRYAGGLPNSIPAPPNTAQSRFRCSSILTPAAPVFEPASFSVDQHGDTSRSRFKTVSMSSLTAESTIELLQKRRFNTAETVPILQRFSIDARPSPQYLPNQTYCNATPPLSAQKDAAVVQVSRQRTNSF